MKNNEITHVKTAGFAKEFGLNEKELNQIVGGCFFFSGADCAEVAVMSEPEGLSCSFSMDACEQSCKNCVSSSISITTTVNKCRSKTK